MYRKAGLVAVGGGAKLKVLSKAYAAASADAAMDGAEVDTGMVEVDAGTGTVKLEATGAFVDTIVELDVAARMEGPANTMAATLAFACAFGISIVNDAVRTKREGRAESIALSAKYCSVSFFFLFAGDSCYEEDVEFPHGKPAAAASSMVYRQQIIAAISAQTYCESRLRTLYNNV